MLGKFLQNGRQEKEGMLRQFLAQFYWNCYTEFMGMRLIGLVAVALYAIVYCLGGYCRLIFAVVRDRISL